MKILLSAVIFRLFLANEGQKYMPPPSCANCITKSVNINYIRRLVATAHAAL